MGAHPPPHHWEPCRYCGEPGPPEMMVKAIRYRADWLRGWVHAQLVEEGSCR